MTERELDDLLEGIIPDQPLYWKEPYIYFNEDHANTNKDDKAETKHVKKRTSPLSIISNILFYFVIACFVLGVLILVSKGGDPQNIFTYLKGNTLLIAAILALIIQLSFFIKVFFAKGKK